MYTVYHLPQLKKVGCTSSFERRMKEQDVEPLEEYIKFRSSDIAEASWAEAELRKFYGYKEDSPMTYKEKFSKSECSTTKVKSSPSHTVGWNELNIGATKTELLEDLNKYDQVVLGVDSQKYVFDKSEFEALVKKAKSSQFKDFYWQSTSLIKLKENENLRSDSDSGQAPCTHGNTIPEFQQIRDWATERGIFAKGDAKTQYLKLQEEAGEVARAILKNDEPEIIDGLGDTLVVLINLSHLAGYKLEDCLASAYDVISKRSGKMVNGTFVKTESL